MSITSEGLSLDPEGWGKSGYSSHIGANCVQAKVVTVDR